MLDATLKSQLQTYLGMLRQPITLIASLDDSATGLEMRSLLDDIVSLSDKVTLDTSGDDARKPSFVVARAGEI
ncbi:MAG: alkyl hydroperoxide reductase subunit F, partial [Gammaproteobacteria bacterium]|nr:alkyl hydroperoxide reductase subunit F [Gammaproteobacteria bacterium]